MNAVAELEWAWEASAVAAVKAHLHQDLVRESRGLVTNISNYPVG